MRKIALLSLIALSSFLFVSCTKGNESDNNSIEQKAETEDVYFVKYASNGLSGRYNATYTKEDGKSTSLQSIAGSDFERTVGPVEKGFKASFTITLNTGGYGAVRIEVKKNDEPFLVKKESTYGGVSYTIE